jgi:hypothetical protein
VRITSLKLPVGNEAGSKMRGNDHLCLNDQPNEQQRANLMLDPDQIGL